MRRNCWRRSGASDPGPMHPWPQDGLRIHSVMGTSPSNPEGGYQEFPFVAEFYDHIPVHGVDEMREFYEAL